MIHNYINIIMYHGDKIIKDKASGGGGVFIVLFLFILLRIYSVCKLYCKNIIKACRIICKKTICNILIIYNYT